MSLWKPDEIARLRNTTLRFSRRLRRHSGPELSPAQLSALSTVERHGTLRVGELAGFERIGKSSSTRLVANLEAQGHVQLLADESDGRGSLVALTDDGRRALEESARHANEYLARQLGALDAADQELIRAALPALDRLLDVKA